VSINTLAASLMSSLHFAAAWSKSSSNFEARNHSGTTWTSKPRNHTSRCVCSSGSIEGWRLKVSTHTSSRK